MIVASTASLLRVWEEQQRAHPVRRALQLLTATTPPGDAPAWQLATIGVRDTALLKLHEALFGGALHTTTRCPQCGERLESEFAVADLCPAADSAPGAASGLRLHYFDYEIDYRLPTSDDLLQVLDSRQADDVADSVARHLMQRCIHQVRRGAEEIDATALPDAAIARLDAEMGRQDPNADVRTDIACPACATRWQARFDVVSYLWSELEDWALRTLADVHALARAYGWSEDAILALSPTRRQIYLDMVKA